MRRWQRQYCSDGSPVAGANVHTAASNRPRRAADTSGGHDTGHCCAASTGSDNFRHQFCNAATRSTRSGPHREQPADHFATSSQTNIHGPFACANCHSGSDTVFHRLFARYHDSTATPSDFRRLWAGACHHHRSTDSTAKLHGWCRAESSTGGRAKSGAAGGTVKNATRHALFDPFAETAKPSIRATSQTAGDTCRSSEAKAAVECTEAQTSRWLV